MNGKLCKNCRFLICCFLSTFLFCTYSNLSFAQENSIDNFSMQNFPQTIENESKFECEVNCCFSIGQNCRAAYHIQKHGKRFQAAPLDWMRDYSLDTCLHLFKTKFSDFFEEIQEIGIYYNYDKQIYEKHIKDTKNNILSIHHFSSENSLSEEHQKFRKMMLNRASKVDRILDKSESIALVYSQDCVEKALPDNQNMIEFLKAFSEIYPDKKIYLIVIETDNIEGIKKKVTFEEDNFKIIKFTFWDCGQDWTGNNTLWDEVMNHIKLVKTF